MKLFNKILLALGMTLCFNMFVLAKLGSEPGMIALLHLEEELTVSFQPYAEGGTDNYADTAFIDKIYVDGREAPFNSFSDYVEYNEAYNTYSWSGDKEAVLTMRIRRDAPVSFRMGIYPDSAETPIQNAGFCIETGDGKSYVDFSGLSGNDITQTYDLSQVDYFRIWASVIFFCLSCVLITFLSRLLDKYADCQEGWMGKLLPIIYSPLFYVVLWAVLARAYYRSRALTYLVGGDTYTYWIQSPGELSWHHRMPVYQLFIMAIQRLTQWNTEETLFPVIGDIQALLGILSCVLFYKICLRLTKRQWLAVLAAVLYAGCPSVLKYEYKILTEALAVDMMIVFVSLLICFLEKPAKWPAFLLGPYCLLCILTRPSFLILLPIILIFFGTYLCAEKNGRQYAAWGLAGAVFLILCLTGYCLHNRQLTGKFMLCDVSYHNELSILIKGNAYQNEEYPEMEKTIRDCLDAGEENSLTCAKVVFEEYGYAAGTEYLTDTLKKHKGEYLKSRFEEWRQSVNEPLFDEDIADLDNVLYPVYRLLFPVTYGIVAVLCLEEICRGFYRWYRDRRVPYLTLGFPALICAVLILTFMTLTQASAQRIANCAVPLVIFMLVHLADSVASHFSVLFKRNCRF